MLTCARPASAWWQVLLHLGVVVVALSVLGMHQLSINHTFADPDTAHLRFESPLIAAGSPHSHAPLAGAKLIGTGTDTTSTFDRGPAQPCADCGGNDAMVMTCLLALTLLVVRWLLRPPGIRPLSRASAPRPLLVAPHTGRRPPALTLAELSLRRT